MNNVHGCKSSMFPNVWQNVKADIEMKILMNVYIAGERIPPTRKIAKDYGIGQSTAQKVLNELCQDGIIESKRGVGYFVKPYIREQLLSERKKSLEKMIRDAVSESEFLNVDLISMVENYTKNKKK